MKKTLIAMAALAAAGVASAQSSVTLFGIADVTLTYGKGSLAKRTSMNSSGLSSSQIGVRGVEDLGGGLRGGFHFEADVAADSGSGAATNTNNQLSGTPGAAAQGGPGTAIAGTQGLTMNRRSTVSLMGGWGELRLGRDYTPHFWSYTRFDPFTTLGIGASVAQTQGNGASAATTGRLTNIANPTGTRASNSIGYLFNSNPVTSAGGAGLYGQVQAYFGENQSNAAGGTSKDGNGYSGRVGYAAGPFDVAVGYGQTKYAASAITGDVKAVNVGASWDFGMAKLMGMWGRNSIDTTLGADVTGWVVGATAPVGAGLIRLAVSQAEVDDNAVATDLRARKYSLGYVHNLSKRTAAYTTVARIRNSGGAAIGVNLAATAANTSSTGFEVGLRHSF